MGDELRLHVSEDDAGVGDPVVSRRAERDGS